MLDTDRSVSKRWEGTMMTQQRGEETRNRILEAGLDAFAQMIEDGIAEGSLRSMNTNTASYVLLAYAVGLLALGLLDPQGADWSQVVQGGMGILLKGWEQR
jgi:hypothetical protein